WVILDTYKGSVRLTIEQSDGSWDSDGAKISADRKTLSLTDRGTGEMQGRFAVRSTGHNTIGLEGRYEGRRVVARLRRVDTPTFWLTTRGFHWIQDQPFNR